MFQILSFLFQTFQDIAEVNEEVNRKEELSAGQIISNKSEKSINTAAKQEMDCASNNEQSREYTSDMNNSEKLIYRKNLVKITDNNESISWRLNKLSDESKKLLNRLDTGDPLLVPPYEEEESASGETTETIFSVLKLESDNSEKSLIRYQHTGVSKRAAQGVETQGYTLTTNWTCDKSKKSLNHLNLGKTF